MYKIFFKSAATIAFYWLVSVLVFCAFYTLFAFGVYALGCMAEKGHSIKWHEAPIFDILFILMWAFLGTLLIYNNLHNQWKLFCKTRELLKGCHSYKNLGHDINFIIVAFMATSLLILMAGVALGIAHLPYFIKPLFPFCSFSPTMAAMFESVPHWAQTLFVIFGLIDYAIYLYGAWNFSKGRPGH